MVKDETALRAAMRDYLRACEEIDLALRDDGKDYTHSVALAETASLARLRLNRELIALGWTPPARSTS